MRIVQTAVLSCLLAFTVGACSEGGPFERAGADADNAIDEVGDAVNDAADNVGDAVDEATEDLDDNR